MRMHPRLVLMGVVCSVAACGSNTDRPRFEQVGGAGGDGGSRVGNAGSDVGSTGGDFIRNPFDSGGATTRPPGCGNGNLDRDEGCDDGNDVSFDGCNRACQIESGYECPTPGQLCIYTVKCGDGVLGGDEQCDDGSVDGVPVDNDGCSHDCKLEAGWRCPKQGKRCVPVCGDSVITGTESCDDGNETSGDGCSSTCVREPGYSCEGTTCTKTKCGNGKVEAGELCDKGEDNGLFLGDGTGCSKTCTPEPSCRKNGKTAACVTSCGDGNIDPGEDCDDSNGSDGDGCSKDCKKEEGFRCDEVPASDTQACSSGSGQCLVLPITYRDFDGQNQSKGHPDFFFMGATVGGNKTFCVPNASGRTAPDNGTCPGTDATPLCSGLVSDVLDTDGKPTLGKSDSSCKCTFTDWDGTGVLDSGLPAGVTMQKCNDQGGNEHHYVKNASVRVIQSASSFKEWYTKSDKSTTIVGKLELTQLNNGTLYQFSSSGGRTVYDDLHDIFSGTRDVLDSGFFLPDDTKGVGSTQICNLWPYWVSGLDAAHCVAKAGNPIEKQWDPRGWDGDQCRPSNAKPDTPSGCPLTPVQGKMRDFYMTSEVRYYFKYTGGEALEFYGDDDVWVFINGHLALDLGSPHERLRGKVTLPAAGQSSGSYAISTQDIATNKEVSIATGKTPALELDVGKTYEIVVFHADRHPRESNYQLTLSGFGTKHSVCGPHCGDGVATADEECDDGDGNNKDPNSPDAYGACTTDCKYGPSCGDGDRNGNEECDEGARNTGVYGKDLCTSACTKAAYCGDNKIDSKFAEECDDGEQNGNTLCGTDCKLHFGPA